MLTTMRFGVAATVPMVGVVVACMTAGGKTVRTGWRGNVAFGRNTAGARLAIGCLASGLAESQATPPTVKTTIESTQTSLVFIKVLKRCNGSGYC